jgi:signal transduction histidine kinase
LNLPIRTRLTAIYCLVFCLGGAVLEAGAYAALNLAVAAIADRELNSRLMGVEEFLSEHLPRMPLARVQREIKTHTALQPDLLRIVSGQRTIAESPALTPYAATPAESWPHIWTAGTTERPLRVLSVSRTINGIDYGLLLADDLTVPFEVVHRFGLWLLLTSPILMAAAATIGHWTAGRALAPVLAITTAARDIDATDLSRRIDIPQSHDELRYLAETLNGMLARIESAFRKSIEFTANASHELRTPLAVIRATAEVALMRGADGVSGTLNFDRVALRQILSEAERNTTLLENLLRLARADSGTVSLRMEPVNAAESLRSACRECEPLAAKRGIQLQFAPPSQAAWVSADEGCLRSLFRIVLDNALKYTPEGGSVDAALLSSLPAHVICRVKDTGIGISEADLPHIFERFYRSDRVRNREEGGAGLGLAIAEWIARSHGGRIEVESALGVGSTFSIILPARRAPESIADSAAHRLSLQGRQA